MQNELDPQINYLISKATLTRHRCMFISIGLSARKTIPVLHRLLSRNSANPIDSVMWCSKNSSIVKDSLISKSKENEDEMSGLELFLKNIDVQFVGYNESDKILGQTVDMLVLQDFESLTPNLIALSMETVRGGGMIVLLLDTCTSLDTLSNKTSEFVSSEEFYPRFNKRLFKSLINSKFTLFIDANMKVLKYSKVDITAPIKHLPKVSEAKIHNNETDKEKLFDLGQTKDQKNVLKELFEVMEDRTERMICSILAGRGRGKSVALGIAVSNAINMKFSSIYVSAPALENVKMVFEFLIKGLEAMGYKKYIDFKIIYSFKGKKRMISRVELNKGLKQTVQYFNPFEELKYHPDMFIIDEAAAIPLPILKKLLFPNLIIMATTISGYEGTGRAFSVKMAEYLRERSDTDNPFSYKEIKMYRSIRYNENDPIEKWLNKTLLLDCEVKRLESCPTLDSCELYYVNRDALFSGNKGTELILQDIFCLFIASHYKNSPNDIQILADSRNHEIFTLITHVQDEGVEVPRVICAIHVSFEGNCQKDLAKKGNLIPWIFNETYFDPSLLSTLGVRIVRIAVHPEYMSLGYGSRALDLLMNFLSSKKETTTTHLKINDDNKSSGILFYEKNDIVLPVITWIGTSFGLTSRLYNFWKKHHLLPICVKQVVSYVTGEHSIILMKSLNSSLEELVVRYNQMFLERFVGQLGYSFKEFKPTLVLSLLYCTNYNTLFQHRVILVDNDIDRLRRYARGTADIYQIIDLVPLLARQYFMNVFDVSLTVLQKCILLMVGLQYKSFEDVAKEYDLKVYEVNMIFVKVVGLLCEKL